MKARKPSIAERLIQHLANDGTMNDMTTDALYREAKRIPEGTETDLEEVELWAVDTVLALANKVIKKDDNKK